MTALVHSADVQDRDGGVLVMATLFGLYPFLLKLCEKDFLHGVTPRLPEDNMRSVVAS